MQSFDIADPNSIQVADQDDEHIDRLYNVYGPRLGLNRSQFIEYVQAHHAAGGQLPNLPNNQGMSGGVEPAIAMNQAFSRQAKAAQDDEYYQADPNAQFAQQELQAEARAGEYSDRRAQAASDAQEIAFGAKSSPEIGDSTFNQILFRGGGSSQPMTPQASASIRGTAQQANFLTRAQRRFRFPRTPSRPR